MLAPPGEDVTVFIHGYKGGFLQTESGELAWISIGQAMSAGDRSLALPFAGQRDGARYGPLKPGGPMTRLTVIPFLFEEDPYFSWMNWAKDALPGFITFSYDWRLDLRESGASLCTFLEGLGPNRRIRLVAHSMGGLVTLQCLRRGPEAVRAAVKKVVFVATPFRGGPGQWDDLHLGSKTNANTKLLEAEALLTMPAAWQLLSPEADIFFDQRGARIDVPAYDASTWIEGHWGVFKEPLDPAYRRQLEERFEAHRALWASLGDEQGDPPAWATMVVIGKGRPTVRAWTLKDDRTFDFTNPLRGDGDGAVLVERAHPPKPIKATIVETTAEHTAMLREPEVQAVIADFLR
ncbi:MAG: alpha/beta hydrolase [Archangium sp.]|nr:alpha/beta hydrolase [Archangium sp.]